MEFTTITKEEFQNFEKEYHNNCYLQSVQIADLREKNGWKAHFLGVKKNKKILAATILLSRKRRFKYEFYAMRGPLVDFNNQEVFLFFLNRIKQYVKENQGYLLRIDPYFENVSRDRDGNQTEDFDHSCLKDTLKSLGFQEITENTTQAKFMYIIDLKDSLEEVMKDMDSKTRQMIRKNEKSGIIIREGTEKDIEKFADIMEDTSHRRHFNDRGIEFYQDMYHFLSEGNHISFIFAELDLDLSYQNIKEERLAIEKAKIDRERKRQKGLCNEEKAKRKEEEEKEALLRLDKKEKEFQELEEKYGRKITLGAILYVLYGDEVASVFGGCYETFKEYQPFYTIHYEMIKYAIQHHYKRYNFYAIQNHTDKENEQYGIYQFKRGFGGHVMELLGEFVLPVDKKIYYLTQFVKKIK